MTEHRNDLDPIDRLRAADPATTSSEDPSLPGPRATLEEILMTDPATHDPRTRRAPWVLMAAALLVVAGVVGAVILAGGDDTADDLADQSEDPGEGLADDPVISPGGDPAGNSQATDCVELYDLETLANREYAFDGTVVSVDGSDMTFAVNEWFTATTVDGTADTITLDHQGNAGMLFAPDGPALEPGTRVLVAGDGGFVWSCGFTQLHDDELASQWRDALG